MNTIHQANTLVEILPAPFEWRAIPAGNVTLTQRGGYLAEPATVSVDTFALARFPITNAQYEQFIQAEDGYHDERWWAFSRDARDWHDETSEPKQVDFGGEDDPRTHIAWYEAVAFCRWLSTRTGELIRLPTEAEWQRAAQGDDGRVFPWGDEWDADLCHNNTRHGSIGTCTVLEYAGRGESPFSVAGMAGNVWEWCATRWDDGKTDLAGDAVRVMRGGSWFDDVISLFRVTARSSWNPGLRSDLRGFRIARSLMVGR